MARVKASWACATAASEFVVPFFSADMKASFHDLHSQCAFLDAVLQYLYTSDPQVNHVLSGCRQGEAKQDWRAADECVVYKEVRNIHKPQI